MLNLHKSSAPRSERPCFMTRLGRDRRGNTLAIVGAALIPLTAMIGSGVDMSRTYMAKTRLQNACDAAALAGRRVMQGDTLDADVVAEAQRFFNFNFPQGTYQTTAFTPAVTRPTSGTVRVAASTRIPTTVMAMFGFETLPLNVTCDASLNFVNTDVMLVLDVTGSMDDSVSGTRKIVALREAVMALYDELAPIQAQLESNGMRLRYGMVPYSSTVNVGRLVYGVDPNYIRSNTPYQTRVANYTTTEYVETGSSSAPRQSQTASSTMTQSDCQNWGNSSPSSSGSQSSGQVRTTTYQYRDWGATGTRTGTRRTCRRWATETTTNYTAAYRFTNWTYREETLDTSSFKAVGGTIRLVNNAQGTVATSGSYNPQQLAALRPGDATSYTWNGCIEERDTTDSITGSGGLGIPSNAFDLDIDRIPNSDATRWRPMLPQAVFRRASGSTAGSGSWTPSSSSVGTTSTFNWQMDSDSSYYACPTEARRLGVWTRNQIQSYVNGLSPIGGTYHDIGMIWGARMISPGGIFADSPNTFANMPVARHIIFMTDGAQTAYCNLYSAYGIERNDMRVKGSSSCTSDSQTNSTTSDLVDRHVRRFRMACNAAKGLGASIWVIAFDQALTPSLIECASNPNQASTSNNRDQLIERFRQIGNQIGALRLTQ